MVRAQAGVGAGIRFRFVLIAVLVSTIGCDRVTKYVATTSLAGTSDRSFLADTVRLTYMENTGAFLGLGAGWPPAVRVLVLTVGTGLTLIATLACLKRYRRRRWASLGLALLLAGGTSNWIDRAFHGAVVDFMNLGIGWLRTGVFNVADVCIMIGAAILLSTELGSNHLVISSSGHLDPQ